MRTEQEVSKINLQVSWNKKLAKERKGKISSDKGWAFFTIEESHCSSGRESTLRLTTIVNYDEIEEAKRQRGNIESSKKKRQIVDKGITTQRTEDFTLARLTSENNRIISYQVERK